MPVIPVGREIVVPNGSVKVRRFAATARLLGGATIVAGLVAAVVTAELMGLPHVRAPGVRSAIETATTLSALVSAGLLLTVFNQTRRVRDLLLLAAVGTVSLTTFFNAAPAFSNYPSGAHDVGARMLGALLVTITLAAAAFTPAWKRIRSGYRLASLAALAGIAIVALGELVDVIAGPGTTGSGPEVYRPIMSTVALASCSGLLIAGLGFASRRGAGDRQAGLLAGASLLLAGAALQERALPFVPAAWVTPAELLRLAAYGLLLATALRLHRRTRDQTARDAISAERQRIARDLHDGLAQDLAFIAAHSNRLALDFGGEHPLAIAAKRALAASRGTIVDLEASKAASTEAALSDVATELEIRFGIEITVRIEAADDPDPTMRERSELVRIAREAIANAACHGGARHVTVTLGSKRRDLLLRISDDGCGLDDPTRPVSAGSGLGIPTMRARARALGAQLIARRGERGGTEIDVVALGREAQPRA